MPWYHYVLSQFSEFSCLNLQYTSSRGIYYVCSCSVPFLMAHFKKQHIYFNFCVRLGKTVLKAYDMCSKHLFLTIPWGEETFVVSFMDWNVWKHCWRWWVLRLALHRSYKQECGESVCSLYRWRRMRFNSWRCWQVRPFFTEHASEFEGRTREHVVISASFVPDLVVICVFVPGTVGWGHKW